MRRLVLAISALLVSACGAVDAHRVAFSPARPPTTSVELVEGTPTRQFTETGIVQAIGHGTANREDVTKALAQEARRMGCDAVVRLRVDEGAAMAHAIGVCAVW